MREVARNQLDKAPRPCDVSVVVHAGSCWRPEGSEFASPGLRFVRGLCPAYYTRRGSCASFLLISRSAAHWRRARQKSTGKGER